MERDLEGARVAITGGAGGIGKATAARMAAAGARVMIGDIDVETAARTAGEIGPGVDARELDVTSRESFETFLDETEASLGSLDCLVNNAGVMILGPADEEAPEATETMVAVNLFGVIHGTQAAMRRMKPRRRGRIVNIASQVGRVGLAGGATYCGTKAAVIGFSEAVRQELEGTGVAISWVLPGLVNTELASGLPDIPLMDRLSPDDVAEAITGTLLEGGSEVWVPARNRWLEAPTRLLPRGLRERVLALTGTDRVLAAADSARRRRYEDQAGRHS